MRTFKDITFQKMTKEQFLDMEDIGDNTISFIIDEYGGGGSSTEVLNKLEEIEGLIILNPTLDTIINGDTPLSPQGIETELDEIISGEGSNSCSSSGNGDYDERAGEDIDDRM